MLQSITFKGITMFSFITRLFSMFTVWVSVFESLGRSANNSAEALEYTTVSLKDEQKFNHTLKDHELRERIIASQMKLDKAQATYEQSKPSKQAQVQSKPVVNSKPATRTTRKPKTA
jgi:anti-sigma-K factor RskA